VNRTVVMTAALCGVLMGMPGLMERTVYAVDVKPAEAAAQARPARANAAENRRKRLREKLHVGHSVLALVARLREVPVGPTVAIASATVLPSAELPRAGELREHALRVTATGSPIELLRYAESVSTSELPVRVESVELTEVSTSSPPVMRLGVRALTVESQP
jgi:hypothetical protein